MNKFDYSLVLDLNDSSSSACIVDAEKFVHVKFNEYNIDISLLRRLHEFETIPINSQFENNKNNNLNKKKSLIINIIKRTIAEETIIDSFITDCPYYKKHKFWQVEDIITKEDPAKS